VGRQRCSIALGGQSLPRQAVERAEAGCLDALAQLLGRRLQRLGSVLAAQEQDYLLGGALAIDK
jgi:hypothetical protein